MTPTALTPPQIAELLRSAATTLRAELAALPETVLAFHPAAGEWCAKEIVGHLIEAERRGFAGRIRQILASRTLDLQAWDQNAVARERRDCERDANELLDEFGKMREASVALVLGLREDDLGRGGRHPKVGLLRIADLLQEWVHHDRNHERQIFGNVQAYVWPHMGNAQGFAGE